MLQNRLELTDCWDLQAETETLAIMEGHRDSMIYEMLLEWILERYVRPQAFHRRL